VVPKAPRAAVGDLTVEVHFFLLATGLAATGNLISVLTSALIAGILRDSLTPLDFDFLFSSASEGSFRDDFGLLVFGGRFIRLTFCWFCTHLDAFTSV
jgi:hypothetical protein